ncbi:MAG: riboflavin kinase, partial [Oscillospiraceae bacterium]
YGVYAAFARVDGALRKAVTNIGVKPTVGSDRPLSETFIFDYSGDLYGKRIRVYLIELLRGEKKFSGLEELKRYIAADSERADRLLDGAARPELL